MIKINQTVFVKLHEEILKKFKSENPNFSFKTSNASDRLYGFGNYKFKKDTVIGSIVRDKRVREYLESGWKDRRKPSGKHLYRVKLEFEKQGKKEVHFRGGYSKIYFIYLGCSNLEEFLIKYLEIQEESSLIVKYSCFYYSFKNYGIKKFHLEVDYSTKPFNCLIEGLHEKGESSKVDGRYEGEGNEIKNYLYINTTNSERNQLNLILQIGNSKGISLKVIRGIFQGVSTFSYPICGEAVLVRISHDKTTELSPIEISDINYYLMMQRRMIRTPMDIIRNTEELKAKRYLPDEFRHLVGIYRIWAFNRKAEIVQSKFTIHDDFTAYLEPAEYSNINQRSEPCTISISSVNGKKICVSALQNQGTELINFAIIDFPSKTASKITKGVYVGVGVERRLQGQSVSGCIVLLKEEEPFEPGVLSKFKSLELRRSDQIYEDFYQELRSVHNRDNLGKVKY